MINKIELENIEEIINQATPCKWCGKAHRVRLFVNISDCGDLIPEAKIFPSGEMLFVEYDDQSCEKFKENVNSFIDSQEKKLIVPNIF